MAGEASRSLDRQVCQELTALLHGVLDARSHDQAEQALTQLKEHPWGAALAQKVNEQFDRLLYHLLECHHGLMRVNPEWLWRDFRWRLSRGRNRGSVERLERAALLWMVYHSQTPTQNRSERKRHYKHPGQSPLEVAGRPQAKSLTWMCCRSERTSLFPRCFQTGKQGDRHLYPRQANRSPTNTFVFSST